MSDPVWITEAEVVDLMALPDAIAALRSGLCEEAAGSAVNMVKTHVTWGDGSTLHAIGAVFEGKGVAATKTWAHTAGGAMPLLVLIDALDGSVMAIIEAFALGQMRTGGISGVATDVLARPDARALAIIGSGKQSLAQVAAVAAVRRLDRVAVWSPTEAKRQTLAGRIRSALGIAAEAAGTLEQAIEGADIVTLATRARTPFLAADALPPGVHINAIGAITPERAEFAPELLDRATTIAADSVAQAGALSREFREYFAAGQSGLSRVLPLSRLVADGASRQADADLTVFKAMGMGISDLSLGLSILDAARRAGLGRTLPRPVRVAPRLAATPIPKVA